MKTYSITYNFKDKSKSKHNVPYEMFVSFPPYINIDCYDRGIDCIYGFKISEEHLSLLTPLYLHNGKILEVYIVDLSYVSQYNKNRYSHLFGANGWVLTTLTSVKNSQGETVRFLRLFDTNELSKAPQKMFVDRNELEEYYSKVNEKQNCRE